MSNSNAILQDQRLSAAIASKGISSNVIYELVLSLCNRFALKGDLLEYGAGAGSLIKLLLSIPYKGRITGADIIEKAPTLPEEVPWILTDLNERVALDDGCFDVIISTEVIEHLENPRATFREFHRLLRTGGKLIVTTPNQESIRSLASLLFRDHFVAFLQNSYPAHITALLRKDLERISLETGFQLPKFYYTNSGGIPKLPHVQWQNVSFGLLKGRYFSDNLAMFTQKL